MQRTDVLLAALAATDRPFYPVHLQKSMFLIADKLPHLFAGEQRYNFEPYDYGPFDQRVYADANALREAGLLSVGTEAGNWYRTYRLTDAGRAQGEDVLRQIRPDDAARVRKVADLVTGMSFRELVAAIYRAYPAMKAKSVFKETV